MVPRTLAALAVATSLTLPALAQQPDHKQILSLVDAHAAEFSHVSRQIWDNPELGYHETKSSALLQDELKKYGFTVQSGVADEPTGFIASYGSGKPVIAMLGEFDALPELSQADTPARKPVVEGAPGHACGHNLLGSGAALAAVAVKEYMEKNHVVGTLRFYGTPAEEGGSGKVYMVRAGLFKDVDVVLHWHPGNANVVNNGGSLAIISAKFTFHGVAAHAAAAPDRGRSALDGVMVMGTGIEYLREHVPSNTRMHYIITKGGAAPNVVPDLAEIYLMARSPSETTLRGIWDRIEKIAQGAALISDTKVETRIISNDANIIGNTPLAELAHKDQVEVGGFTYTPEEHAFAAELQKSLPAEAAGNLDSTAKVLPIPEPDPNRASASTDVGDVSWFAPTIGFSTPTFVPGVAAHTWQAAATTGMSIGQKGMVLAAKDLALTAADLFAQPATITAAKEDFKQRTSALTYYNAIPEGQKALLNYREQ
ncbi:MAG TPA: amidohydrolase [Granulicella sp.]